MADNASHDEKGAYCANCEERPQVGGQKLLQCSSCHKTSYCNRECQKNHWQFHKHRCRQIQQCRQSAIDNNQKRLRSLINEWLVESKHVLQDCLGGYFRWEMIASMEQLRFAVFLKVKFDYNYCTFVPTEPPIIGPAVNGHPQASQLHSLYEEAKQVHLPSHMRQNNAVYAPVVCFIAFNAGDNNTGVGVQTCMVEKQQTTMTSTMSFDKMVENLKKGVDALTSKKFTTWHPLRSENTKKQINAITQHENFKPLAAHALHMFTNASKNLSHVVKIYLKEGFGLGEIVSLERYELVTIQDAKLEAQRKKTIPVGGNLPIESQNDAVVWLSSDHICYFFALEQQPRKRMMASGTRTSIEECDRKALESFCALARIQLPPIQTPDLH